MVLGFITGLIAANAAEWNIHKYLLHEQARKKDSFWRFHWAEHHKTVSKSNYYDQDYQRNLFSEWNAQSKEAAGLALGALAVAPIAWVSPGFAAGVWVSVLNYYRVHKRSHLDPAWGYKHLPWHYDHHMGPDQDKNWCVTFPLWDYVKGTRVPYKGTEREQKDLERKHRREQPVVNKIIPTAVKTKQTWPTAN